MSDYSETQRIAERMKATTRKLHELAPQVGIARQCREYDSDRRKNLLAKYVLLSLKAGESAAASETIGRATPAYQAELESLANQLQSAEAVIAQWTAEQASYEAARSLLSFQKSTMENLKG